MISIIVPVYNAEQFLDDCIESLIHQSYQDIEIILVDDGSTDSSPDICDWHSLHDSRVKVIHQNNAGQSAARNAGLRIATGQFVTFVDSDDWVDTDFCGALLDIIGDGDLAICSHQEVYKRGGQLKITESTPTIVHLDNEALWQEIFGRLNNAVWNKLYRRDLLEGINFPLNMYHGEDLLFNLEYISRCKRAVLSSKRLYNYYKHPGSVTSSGFSSRKKFEITTKDAASEFVKLHHRSLLPTAQRYCFRSRLNVLRSIYSSDVCNEQVKLVDECKGYLKDNYAAIADSLSFKDKIERFLVLYSTPLYRLMLKVVK